LGLISPCERCLWNSDCFFQLLQFKKPGERKHAHTTRAH
jgi:hypothetical protein